MSNPVHSPIVACDLCQATAHDLCQATACTCRWCTPDDTYNPPLGHQADEAMYVRIAGCNGKCTMSQCNADINIYDALIAHVPRYYLAKYDTMSHLFYNNDHRTIHSDHIDAQINYYDLRIEFADMLDNVYHWLMSNKYTRSAGDLEDLRSINCIYQIIHTYVGSNVANKADDTDDDDDTHDDDDTDDGERIKSGDDRERRERYERPYPTSDSSLRRT